MTKIRRLPLYRLGWVVEFRFKDDDGKIYDVFQSERSYAIAMEFRAFIRKPNLTWEEKIRLGKEGLNWKKASGQWFELNREEKCRVF